MLLNFKNISVGGNSNIEFSLCINLAGEGAINWAIRLAGKEVGTKK